MYSVKISVKPDFKSKLTEKLKVFFLRTLSVIFHISRQTTCISSDISKQTRRVKKCLFLHCKANDEVDCQIRI